MRVYSHASRSPRLYLRTVVLELNANMEDNANILMFGRCNVYHVNILTFAN